MIKEHRELIRDIFDNDKEIRNYCDVDFITYNKEISDQIILKINGCLIQYPTTYIFADQERKFFAVRKAYKERATLLLICLMWY